MSSEWVNTTLGDVTNWYSGGTPKKDIPEYWGGDIPWISASSMQGTRFTDSDLCITEAGLVKGSRLASKNSVLLLVRGSSLHNRVPVGISTRDVAFNQDVKAIVPKSDLLNPLYLLYWIMGHEKYLLESVVEFTGIGAGKLDTKRMQGLEFLLPPRQIQDEIVEVVKSLDDRIALLRETNTTLESIAQALFKSWFVDFDPVHANAGTQAPSLPPEIQSLFPSTFVESSLGLVPEGWGVCTLGDVMENHSTTFNFTNVDKVVFVNTGDVSEGVFLHKNYSSPDGLPGQAKKTIKRDDILFSEIRPKNNRYAYVNFDPEEYVVSTKFMILRSLGEIHPRYIYQIIKQPETIDYFNVIAESRSGTFPQITFDAIKSYKIIRPNKECIEKYIALLIPLLTSIDENFERQKSLTLLRGTLLPRLISGQLRLPETDSLIGELA